MIVTAGRVLAAPDGAPLHDGAVLVATDGTISAIGTQAEVVQLASPDVDRWDFPDKTVLPGLVNCHIHLAFDASADPAATLRNTDDVALLAAMTERAGQLLDAGITTARDLGDRGGLAAQLRNAIGAGTAAGPRILTAGAPLTVVGGHCWFLGGEVTGDASIRAAVADHAAYGVDVIKVMVSGGHMTPGGAAMWEPQFDARQLEVVVDAAREVGLPVAAHAHGTDSIIACVEAGVDTIEHCTWLVGHPAEGRYGTPDHVAEMIAAAGIYVCPARSSNWETFKRLDSLLDRLAWMDRHGLKVVAGTDAGVTGSFFDDFARSLGLYARAGWSPARVLAMATTEAAAAIGLADSIGQLKPGFSADLIAVDGDPLADLDALGRVRFVLARGRVHLPPAASGSQQHAAAGG
nr:amidohydrolase family protein [Pseudonocardia acidicola]